MNLIIPMAGRSSRFPGIRPKWMLTHPSGKFMAIEAIMGLNLEDFTKIIFVYLAEHEKEYKFLKGFKDELNEFGLIQKVTMVELKEPTKDQPQTVYEAIKKAKITGPITIKDSDNFFKATIQPGNSICYFDLNLAGLIKPKNKSYVMIDHNNQVTNIIEKQVISPFFCVGAYGFEDAETFCKVLEGLDPGGENYISNIIYQMLLREKGFVAVPVQDYSDWGTLQDWDNYKRSFATLFVDMDGVIAQHSASHFPPYYGETGPIADNLEILKKLKSTGKFQIIITTSRHEQFRKVTEQQLQQFGLKFDHLIMGLQHGKRIIINDYSKSNPFKSCDSINLKRNSNELKEILRESLGIDYEEL